MKYTLIFSMGLVYIMVSVAFGDRVVVIGYGLATVLALFWMVPRAR